MRAFPGFLRFLCPMLALLLLTGGCQPAGSSQPERKPLKRIVCTTGMVGDLVRQIAGPEVEVLNLLGPGVDPHLFSPSPGDVEKLATADAIIYSGLHLEAGLSGYLEKLAQKNPRVWAVAEGVSDPAGLLEVAPGLYDPHFWNDLELWQQAATALAEKLAEWEPDNAAGYRQRAAEYRQQLADLLEESRRKVAELPEERRLLVTAHDAFEYLGRSLELQVYAAQGISTNTEPSVRKVEELVELIVSRKIPALFTESSVSDKPVRAILHGCQQRGHAVKPGGVLYSDALGPQGSGAETFLEMYRHNVQTIVQGLAS